MEIKQIYDPQLAHGSYAIMSNGKVAVVDPGRDPKPYEDFADQHSAEIVAVLETHPHADFVSCHLELHEKYGAMVYVNSKMGVDYPHKTLDHNETMELGGVKIKALFTPGHSPDHNSYLLFDEEEKEYAIFTGDSLFVGDVGRPDLREGAGNLTAKREELAKMMFHTIQDVFNALPDHVIVYPAHGAGSLCGKNMSKDTTSTMSREKQYNWAFQIKDESKFMKELLDGQPFVPKYFPYDVEMNRKGAPGFETSVKLVKEIHDADQLDSNNNVIIDSRKQDIFKAGHLKGAINIPNSPGDKFETWLGSIVGPEEKFYIVAANEESMKSAIRRAAKIGYEQLIAGALINPPAETMSEEFDPQELRMDSGKYTIVDIRNESELESGGKIFEEAINIPLHKLRENVDAIPKDKPVVVHCAGGYRSAAGASILEKMIDGQKVYDLSDAIRSFSTQKV